MSIIENIKLNNQRLGIETIFYNANNDILGYSENNKIYLNTFYLDDIDLVNKHEILHFFCDSQQFKFIKKVIFSILDENKIDKLREIYLLKYNSLYDEEEIKNGILDEEIAIDIITNNGPFPIKIEEYVKDAYEAIINQSKSITLSNETRKYLNISLSKKIDQQFPKLSKWEKLFVLNYYNGKDKLLPNNKETKYEDIRKDIKKELEILYQYGNEYSNFVIDNNSKEIVRKLEIEIKKLMQEGDVDSIEDIKNNFEQNKRDLASIISNSLQREYQKIVETLKRSNYDYAFKYLMLNETLNRFYKKEKIEDKWSVIVDKRIDHESVSSHLTLNNIVLETIYNNVDQYKSFTELYFASLEIFNERVKEENLVHIDDINTFNKGKWLKFSSRKNDEENFIDNAQKLTALVKDTIWCTKTQASMHLEKGDYYIFVDNEGSPHIAIRMIGNDISEVRGIENGDAQEIEDEYRKVVVEFLSKNKSIKYGKEWLEKEEWNKRLINYINKLSSRLISEDEIESLIYDITEVNDYKIHFHKNKNKEILINLVKNNSFICQKIAEKYNCDISEVGFEFNKGNKKFPYKVFIGDMTFHNQDESIDYSNLKYIIGDVFLENANIDTLTNLEIVQGNFKMGQSLIRELPSLRKVGGGIMASRSKIEKLNNLELIGGDSYFYCSNIKEMYSLKYIGGNASFSSSNLENLDNLEYVKGSLVIKDSKIKSMKNLRFVGGNADFSNSKLEYLIPNCEILGNINIANSPLENKKMKRQ